MPEQNQTEPEVGNITYTFQGAESVSLIGTEEVFTAIKAMIEVLPQGSTYHHFYGYNDRLWNELGLTDRARNEVVPKRVARRLKTVGLYFPTDWVIQRFGGDIAEREHRHYDLLPEGIEIGCRFYVYRDTVLHIFKDGTEYNGTLVTSQDFAERHRGLVERMKKAPRILSERKRADIIVPNDEPRIRSVAVFALLDCFYDGVNCIKITEPSRGYMQQLLAKSKGLEVIVE